MVAGFCLSCAGDLVAVPVGGVGGYPHCANHGELSIDQAGEGESGKQFAIGMKLTSDL
jgi:hypothetical protein